MGRHVDWATEDITMATPGTLPDDVLDRIADQIGLLMADASTAFSPRGVEEDVGAASEAPIEMTHTFEIWVLSVDALRQPANNLSQLAKPTGDWHHQINRSGITDFFARSCQVGQPEADDRPSTWQVVELLQSQLAEQIDHAVDWTNKHVHEDLVARLLVVPAYQLHAFLLLKDGKSQIFVIDCPERLGYLRSDEVLDEPFFLESLRKEQPIVGRSQANTG